MSSSSNSTNSTSNASTPSTTSYSTASQSQQDVVVSVPANIEQAQQNQDKEEGEGETKTLVEEGEGETKTLVEGESKTEGGENLTSEGTVTQEGGGAELDVQPNGGTRAGEGHDNSEIQNTTPNST